MKREIKLDDNLFIFQDRMEFLTYDSLIYLVGILIN